MGDLLDDSAALAAAGAKAKAAGLLALDTEFVWTRTYWPRMGIVQLGAQGECWALDCLAPLDAAPLRALLGDGQVTKILHDARQDLTHLRHWCGAAPVNVFDTRLAAAFAGFPAGIGLQKLLSQTLGVELPKTETRTDWTARPLSAAQVRYALDDVRHLPALRDDLWRRAGELGTREWLAEDLRQYDDPALYADAAPETAWLRVKCPRGRLNRQGLAVLRAVAAAREEMARQWDVPRSWAGEDGSLVGMALTGRAGQVRHRLRGGKADMMRERYARAVAAALALPPERWPEDPFPQHPPKALAAADAALAWLAARAAELRLDPTVIASRATVTAFVAGPAPANPLATGWRHRVIGREMAARFAVA